MRYDIEITFEESFSGVRKEINLYREEVCDVCHGTKAKPGSKVDTCTVCGGTGQIKQVQTTFLGQMQTVKTCTACGGTGKVIHEACDKCKGTGRIKKPKKISIDIPARNWW